MATELCCRTNYPLEYNVTTGTRKRSYPIKTLNNVAKAARVAKGFSPVVRKAIGRGMRMRGRATSG